MPRILNSVADALAWLAKRGAVSITTDSRTVINGDAFIAWPGATHDGRQFVSAAIRQGAVACIVEADGMAGFDLEGDERIAAMKGLKALTGPLAHGFLGKPSERLRVIAVTGTNGKTSSTWWVAQALTALGHRAGVIGTLGIGEPPSGGDPGNMMSTGLTTPDPVVLHAAFKSFADAGFDACAIEASSVGIVEHRLTGTHIHVGMFTNFTQDHLDFHGDMASYWQAKAQLFAWPGLGAAVLNLDDPQGMVLARALQGSDIDVWTYSAVHDARLYAHEIGYYDGGLGFDVYEGEEPAMVRTSLIGDYNVSNLLGVIGALRALGVELADAARVCSLLSPVPGRMHRVSAEARYDDEVHNFENLPEVVVDYAHTPDALEKALKALQPLAQLRDGKLWCVFGCGGNRDATKRPIMGAIAQEHANCVVVTSDNPRMENPTLILSQIVAGMTPDYRPIVIEDRRLAIAQAVQLADSNDVVLIAGKGHEDYQDVNGVKYAFSDVTEAHAALIRYGELRRSQS